MFWGGRSKFDLGVGANDNHEASVRSATQISKTTHLANIRLSALLMHMGLQATKLTN